jgi:hypothetical protein
MARAASEDDASPTTILRIAPARAAACVLLVFASSANAEVFCVKDPACPAGGIDKATLADAFQAANVDALEDTIRLGTGNYDILGLGSSKPVDIVGAGVNKTIITDTNNGTVLYLNNAESSVKGLTLLPTQPNSEGIRLVSGADATDVSIVAPDSAINTDGFIVEGPGSVVQTIARRGAKPRIITATVKSGRWSLRVRTLRRGTTRFTARGLASDGRTAKASRRVTLR